MKRAAGSWFLKSSALLTSLMMITSTTAVLTIMLPVIQVRLVGAAGKSGQEESQSLFDDFWFKLDEGLWGAAGGPNEWEVSVESSVVKIKSKALGDEEGSTAMWTKDWWKHLTLTFRARCPAPEKYSSGSSIEDFSHVFGFFNAEDPSRNENAILVGALDSGVQFVTRSAGTSAITNVENINPREWHIYTIQWLPDRVRLIIDSRVVAEHTVGVPQSPLRASFMVNSKTLDCTEKWKRMYVDWVEIGDPIDNRSVSLFLTDDTPRIMAPGKTFTVEIGVLNNVPVPLENLLISVSLLGPQTDHVVISEVYADPVVSYDRTEYVELYNPTSSDICLEGYSLWEEGTQKIVFDSTHVIPAHGYFLVADGQYSDYKNQENENWPEPDATAAWALSNSGDAVILKDPDGNVVDIFGYADTAYYEGESYPSTPPEGSSAERYSSSARDPAEDRGNAFDTDNNAWDFFEQPLPNPENSSHREEPPPAVLDAADNVLSIEPHGAVVVRAPLEVSSNAPAGVYELVVRATWENHVLDEVRENIRIAASGVLVEVRSEPVVFAGGPVLATVTIANLTDENIENARIRAYLWNGENYASYGRNFLFENEFNDNRITFENVVIENGRIRLARVPLRDVKGRWSPAHILGYGDGISVTSAKNDGTTYVFALRGAGTTDFYCYDPEANEWRSVAPAPVPAGSGAALTTVYLENVAYIYALQGGENTEFMRYRVDLDSWELLAPLPKPVSAGGALAWTGDNHIWALRGGSNELWRYDIEADAWELVSSYYTFEAGASLVWDGENHLLALKGGGSASFYRYSIPENSWSRAASLPGTVGAGGSLLKVGNYIYAVQGGGKRGFFRYDIANDNWENLPELPAPIGWNSGNRLASTGNDIYIVRGVSDGQVWRYNIASGCVDPANVPAVGDGACAVFVGGSVYYIPGGGDNRLWAYDFSTNSWKELAEAPVSFGAGASLASNGKRLYVLAGGGSTEFLAYDLENDSWIVLANAPGPITGGAGLAWTGGDYIYATQGGSRAFWRYSISANSWEGMAELPGTTGSGSALVWFDNYIYATKGGGSSTFYRYDIETDSWTRVAPVPSTIGSGGSLARVENYIYCVQGYSGDRNGVYRYDPFSDVWENVPSTPAPITGNAGNRLVYDGKDLYYIRGVSTGDFWRLELTEYYPSGSVITQPIDLGPDLVSIDRMVWSRELLPGTFVAFQTRTSGDGATWSEWSKFMATPVVTSPDNRYLQIRVTLKTRDPTVSPTLAARVILHTQPWIDWPISLGAQDVQTLTFSLKAIGIYSENRVLKVEVVSENSLATSATQIRIVSDIGAHEKLETLVDSVGPKTQQLIDLILEVKENGKPFSLENVENLVREYRGELLGSLENIVIASARALEDIRYIEQHGSSIKESNMIEFLRFVKTAGKFPPPARNLLKYWFDNRAISNMERFAAENPDQIIEHVPEFTLKKYRQTLEHGRRIFVNTAAALLHIEVSTWLERRPQTPDLTSEQFMKELKNAWSSVAELLNQAKSLDNQLYQAITSENWQLAYEASRDLAALAENSAFDLVAPIHLSVVARKHFRENGTADNVREVAEYELKFTRALDRFIYYYQKGLWFNTIALAALHGDTELARPYNLLQSDPEYTVRMQVDYVVDGDTIRGYVLDNAPEYGLRSGDYMYVKLVGINAPELDEFKGAEAKEFLENLVSPGDNVRLLVDPKEAFDAYGRILAVVFAENSRGWINLNSRLLTEGYAGLFYKEPEGFYPSAWEWVENLPFSIEYQLPPRVTPSELLENPAAYDNQLVLVSGFVENVDNRIRYTEAGPVWYTVFRIKTYENDNLKLPVLWPEGHLNHLGVENGSFVELWAVFHENCPAENGPDLHALLTRLTSSADVVPDLSPKSWETLEPWVKRAYVREGFTRAWGIAEFVDNTTKTGADGWLQAATRRLSSVYMEYVENPWWLVAVAVVWAAGSIIDWVLDDYVDPDPDEGIVDHILSGGSVALLVYGAVVEYVGCTGAGAALVAMDWGEDIFARSVEEPAIVEVEAPIYDAGPEYEIGDYLLDEEYNPDFEYEFYEDIYQLDLYYEEQRYDIEYYEQYYDDMGYYEFGDYYDGWEVGEIDFDYADFDVEYGWADVEYEIEYEVEACHLSWW